MFTNYGFLGRVILQEIFFISALILTSIRTISWISWKGARTYNCLVIYFFKRRMEHFSHLVFFPEQENKECIYCASKQLHLQMPNHTLRDEYKLQHILVAARKICLSCRLEQIKNKKISIADCYSDIPIEMPRKQMKKALHSSQSHSVLICDKSESQMNKNIISLESDENQQMGNRLSMSDKICFFDLRRQNEPVDGMNEVDVMQKKIMEERAENLICSFKPLDLAIHIYGQIPIEENAQRILFEIFRETAINAIVHGRANNLWIYIRQMENASRIEIENDGIIPTKQIAEHRGLGCIRKNVKLLNGKMELNMNERFCICIEIPNGSIAREISEEQWII